MMPNYNPETGVRYGVITLNSLDPDVVQDLWLRGTDLTWQDAMDELRREVESEADEIEEQARIKAMEFGITNDREYEDFIEREVEARYNARGYDNREEYVEDQIEHRKDGLYVEEPTIEGELDGVKYRISHLGGAPLLWVFEGPVGRCRGLCSPCVPNAGDLDSGFTIDEVGDGYECYVVPQDWMRSES